MSAMEEHERGLICVPPASRYAGRVELDANGLGVWIHHSTESCTTWIPCPGPHVEGR
jgi:hypothetical protein